jgi:hypothetical protein
MYQSMLDVEIKAFISSQHIEATIKTLYSINCNIDKNSLNKFKKKQVAYHPSRTDRSARLLRVLLVTPVIMLADEKKTRHYLCCYCERKFLFIYW